MAGDRRVAVLGAGAWGTALANLAARAGAAVTLWARDPGHVAEMAATGFNARRLPGVPLATAVHPDAALAAAATAGLVLAVVPAQALRHVLTALAPHVGPRVPIILCAKGIEQGTNLFMSEVAAAVLPDNPLAVLSGPSFAADVARGLPTAVTLAARDLGQAETFAAALAAPWFRLYHTTDVRGVEIGGGAKNVLAIASGIAAGRGLGASAGAALLARGFAELNRFGRAFGAEPGTLAGLSGLGDLVLTCGSPQSRNFAFGEAIGRGEPLAQLLDGGKLAEGAYSCGALAEMARAENVDMPIVMAVEAVLTGRSSVDEAIGELLARPRKAEG
jgi:glycerol-3-phosphate dehydrogenase (NAD(P)+)